MPFIYVVLHGAIYLGHETTASVLSWSIYSLAKHKKIQERLYSEVKEVIGDKQYIDGQVQKTKWLNTGIVIGTNLFICLLFVRMNYLSKIGLYVTCLKTIHVFEA